MEATISYSGLPPGDVISGSYTLSHGVSPGIINIEAVLRDPTNPNVQREGSVTIAWQGFSVILRRCVLDSVDIEVDGSGNERMSLTILDRRHAWRDNGLIEGQYNVRFATTSGYRSNQRSTRELAVLCLEAMGERHYDVSRMPNNLYPPIEWEEQNPSRALSELGDLVGFRPVFNPFLDRLEMWPAGVGKDLPVNGYTVSGRKTLDPKELPDAIRYIADVSYFQADIQLIPVADDFDGTLLPLNKVSYLKGLIRGPADSQFWWQFDSSDIWQWHGVKDPRARHLAKSSVLRKYQISPFHRVNAKLKEDGDPPVGELRFSTVDSNQPIESIDRILPLLNHTLTPISIEQPNAPSNVKFLAQMLPPKVWGYFNGRYDTISSTVEDAHRNRDALARREDGRGFFRATHVNLKDPSIFFNDNFDLDVESGVVTFPDPVFIYLKENIDRLRAPKVRIRSADLVLRVAFRVRDKESRAFHRAFVDRNLRSPVRRGRTKHITNDQANLLTLIDLSGEEANVDRDARGELRLRRKRKSAGERISNLQDVEEVGNRYINAELRNLRQEEPLTLRYVGFHPIAPDGARSQIRWALSPDGRGETQATYNDEVDEIDVTYIQKRWNERVQAVLDQEANTRKARQNRQENNGKVAN